MNYRIVLGLVGTLLSGSATGAEVRATFGGWQYGLTGTATDAGTVYDFQRDLGVNRDSGRSLQLAWDTGPGWWPDLELTYSGIKASGTRTVPSPPPLPGSRTLAVAADAVDVDLTARYPWRWNDLSTSLGLTLKQLAGDIRIDDSDQAQPSRQQFNEIIPQGQLQLRWHLSRILILGATGQGIAYDGDRAVEWRAGSELRLFEPVLVEFGLQEKRYKLTAGDYALDARVRGLYLRVGVAIPR